MLKKKITLSSEVSVVQLIPLYLSQMTIPSIFIYPNKSFFIYFQYRG